MQIIEVGKPFKQILGKEEGCYFTFDDSGCMLILNFSNPTQKEIENTMAKQPFKIALTTIDNIIFVTAKCGDLNIIDAPYSPCIDLQVPITPITDGCGYALTLVLADARDGTVKNVRIISLSTSFSKALNAAIVLCLAKGCTYEQYLQSVINTQNKFTSKEIAKMSNIYFKI